MEISHDTLKVKIAELSSKVNEFQPTELAGIYSVIDSMVDPSKDVVLSHPVVIKSDWRTMWVTPVPVPPGGGSSTKPAPGSGGSDSLLGQEAHFYCPNCRSRLTVSK